jgi:hypothetical protein
MLELLQDDPALVDRAPTGSSEAIDSFLQRLVACPLADWHRVATVPTSPAVHAATRALAAAICTPDTLYAAWLVRDHVETACHRFESPEARRVHPSVRRDVRIATERAALALLVRASLGRDHFDALYGGFAVLLTP